MAKIEDIRTYEFSIPLIRKLEWGIAGKLEALNHVLIEVQLNDGSVGYAEATPRPTIYGETASSIKSIIQEEIKPHILGTELHRYAIWQIWSEMQKIKNNNTAKGSLDIALHDAYSKSIGKNMIDYLGIQHEKIPVSYILGLKSIYDSIAEAEDVYSKGVRTFKIKIGKDISSDIIRIKEMIANLPENLKFYVDANECFTPNNAAYNLNVLRNLGCLYCEEPLDIKLTDERSILKADNIIPIIADDSVKSMDELISELQGDTFDILNIKSPKTGITESLEMIIIAQSNDKSLMFGSHASASLGAYTTALLAAKAKTDIPSEASFFINTYEDILENPLVIEDGYIHIKNITPPVIRRELLK